MMQSTAKAQNQHLGLSKIPKTQIPEAGEQRSYTIWIYEFFLKGMLSDQIYPLTEKKRVPPLQFGRETIKNFPKICSYNSPAS